MRPRPNPLRRRPRRSCPPPIDSVALLALPDGEEPDHTDQQERLTDGDTSTRWSTQHYASPDFGGLKEGVGIRLDFAEPSTFTAVTLSTAQNNGGVIELRSVAEDGSPGEVLATGEFVADGESRLEAPEKLDTDKVMLWIRNCRRTAPRTAASVHASRKSRLDEHSVAAEPVLTGRGGASTALRLDPRDPGAGGADRADRLGDHRDPAGGRPR